MKDAPIYPRWWRKKCTKKRFVLILCRLRRKIKHGKQITCNTVGSISMCHFGVVCFRLGVHKFILATTCRFGPSFADSDCREIFVNYVDGTTLQKSSVSPTSFFCWRCYAGGQLSLLRMYRKQMQQVSRKLIERYQLRVMVHGCFQWRPQKCVRSSFF